MVSSYLRAAFLLLAWGALATNEKPPHIIVIMADDLGWNDVGFHGSSQIPTPNIDALAYNGIILNRHYVLPSCTPSRTAFLTGKYPYRMGMQGAGIKGGEPRGLPTNEKTIPQYLSGLGYVTRLIGKWHVGYHTNQHTPLEKGFKSFFGFYNSYITYFEHKFTQSNMSGFDLHRQREPARDTRREYVTDLFTKEALRIIQNHDIDQPLYLQISHLAVHTPLEVPDEDYTDKKFAHIKEPNRRTYAAMVSRLDDSVGQVFVALADKRMLKDSLVLFLSDNGAASVGQFRNWGSNFPLRGTKYSLYEGGVRGVAAIWSPRLYRVGRVSEQFIHITDWLPTLYSAAGGHVEALGDLNGFNLWKALSDEAENPRKSILLNIDDATGQEAAIKGRYKLIRGSYKHTLYDAYHGDSGREPDSPTYNTSNVLGSTVSQIIQSHLGGPTTQETMMMMLRRKATVECQSDPSRQHWRKFVPSNETECLFDIIDDPCERKNKLKDSYMIVQELDLFLKEHGERVQKQVKMGIDWHADPRRTNGTWEPWLDENSVLPGPYTSGMATRTLAISGHIALVLLIVGVRAFI